MRDSSETFLRREVGAEELLHSLAQRHDCESIGEADTRFATIARYEEGIEGSLSYCALPGSRAAVGTSAPYRVVICSPENADTVKSSLKIVTADPRAAFIDALGVLFQSAGFDFVRSLKAKPSVSPGQGCTIDPSASVSLESILGENVRIEAGVIVGPGCLIGDRTVIRSGAVIGEDGIALHRANDGRVLSQPHVGTVFIGADCQIGANTVVVRGMVGRTEIGPRTVIGNLCNIGHGVTTAEEVWMSVGCMIGGHASIGEGATLGMGCRIRDNVRVGARSNVGMGSVVTKSVDDDGSVFGNPARPIGKQIRTGPKR